MAEGSEMVEQQGEAQEGKQKKTKHKRKQKNQQIIFSSPLLSIVYSHVEMKIVYQILTAAMIQKQLSSS